MTPDDATLHKLLDIVRHAEIDKDAVRAHCEARGIDWTGLIMMQPEFDLTPPTEKAPWRTVRESSIAAYVEGRDHLDRRERDAMRTLASFHNSFQMWPTSAEAFHWANPDMLMTSAEFKLGTINFRRAISDLQHDGIVEPNGYRSCRVSRRRKVETWRVIPVGRS